MFKNETKTRMMAMAVVAMFMLTAFSIALVDEQSDATGTGTSVDPYVISIRTGDNFSYTPTVNLAGTTITASQTARGGSEYSTTLNSTAGTDVLAWSGTVLSGSFTNTGVYKVKLVASWSISSPSLTQTAEQYIQFNVVGHLALGADQSKAFSLAAMPTGNKIDTITPTSTMAASSPNIAWAIESQVDSSNQTVSIFELSAASGATTDLRFTSASPGVGNYVVTVQATETLDNITFSDTIVYNVSVGAQSSATPVVITTYIGNTSGQNSGTTSFTSTGTFHPTSWTDTGSANTNITFDDETNVESPTWTVQVSDGSGYGFSNAPTTIEAVATQNYTYVATGYDTLTNGNTDPYNVNVSFTYNVYAKLAFTSAPTMSGTSGYSSQANALDVIVSTNVGSAKKVIFNWGDNTSTTLNTSMYDSVVSQAHKYAVAGTYLITVSAYNDFGNTASVIMYNASNDSVLNPAPTHEITIKDGADTSRTLGSIEVEEGKNFRISAIVIDDDAKEFMNGKKIVALYTEAATIDGEKVTFDATKQWKESNIVYSSSPVTLYADVQDTTASDDFFAEHGWIFIVFIILTILAIVLYFYFGIQHPAVLVMAVVFAVFAILCFVCKDFNGIWDAITGIFKSE